ncbi:MAG: mechanosensitive ion channel domain-containing protein [Ferrovibrionaceae bacterium]
MAAIAMTGLGSFADAILNEPLAGGFATIVVGAVVSRLLFGRRPAWLAIARVFFLILLTVLLLRGGIVPYQPMQPSGVPLRDAIVGVLKVAWWFWAAWFLVSVISLVIVFEERPREGKLLRDFLSALIYLAAVFAIVAYVFGEPVQGLLATSGAIAIILGLALQSTLNDFFSGLVLNFSRPFRPGDTISIDGVTEGQVVEMNWRATHILTGNRDLAILPNSTIAKAKIVNLDFPSGIHGFTAHARFACPPAQAVAVLELALLNARAILAAPSPSIRVVAVADGQTDMEVTAFVDGVGAAGTAHNDLFDLIYRHTAAAGLRLAAPQGRQHASERETLPVERPHAEAIIEIMPLFAALTRDERAAIAAKLKPVFHERGEVVVSPDQALQSLFIVGRGVLSVVAKRELGDIEVLRFGPGDHYGEIGLLTGARAQAVITALAPSLVYELAKDDLAPILEARSLLAHELGHAMAERQAAGRMLTTAELGSGETRQWLRRWFADRLHQLFELEASPRGGRGG